jgi:hypothetical protein
MIKHRPSIRDSANTKDGTHCTPIGANMAELNDFLTQLNYLS